MKDSVVFIRPKFEEKSDMQREQPCSPTPPPPPTWKVFRHLKVAGKSQSFASMAAAALPSTRAVIVLAVVFSLLAAAVSVPWINNSLIITSTTGVPIAATSSKTLIIAFNTSISDRKQPAESASPPPTLAPPPLAIIPFSCPALNQTKTTICKAIPSIPPPENSLLSQTLPTCPDYFRWIHEDLSPWRRTGITKEMVELAGRTANFRLVILGGRAFVQRLRPSFQTRDVFTIWGIVQLLRRYPGRVPDLDLMFDTVDYPVVKAAEYRGRNASAPPPLFRYCGDDSTLDVVFPDWSFWGWPEINIKPWERLRQELKEANEMVKWMDREPYAYWKGNPAVAAARRDLLRCNVSESHDWNARLYAQDWQSEINKGFKESNLSSQCLHRYKIYIEGSAWSVSEKYILACNSMTLIVKPRYYDFFTRGLMPVHHYWPVRHDDKCSSIKFAVDWANSHKRKAQAIGNAASSFIEEKLKMDDVYDYMFHLLNEYSKLLRFRPAKPRRAIELCAEAMACPAQNLTKRFMMDSMVRSPHGSPPCALSPPLSPAELRAIQWRKANSIKQVEIWEERARESQNNK